MNTTDLLFTDDNPLGFERKATLDRDGHLLLPGLLTPTACERLTQALAGIEALAETAENPDTPRRYAAEHDAYLASVIGHPQMLALVREILGPDVRFDHCASLNRPSGNKGMGWHSHRYADARPELGFVRIFFYVNGFADDDGGLKAVPGSHLFRDAGLRAADDDEFRAGWLAEKRHPLTGERLEIEPLNAPAASVALMWTHAAHAVSARKPESTTRWTVVYGYRNPGEPSGARWISPEFEQNPPPGTESLLPLY